MNAGQELSTAEATGLNTPELTAFYADRRLMWRNVLFMYLGWWGHTVCFTVIGPLMLLRMKVTSSVMLRYWASCCPRWRCRCFSYMVV